MTQYFAQVVDGIVTDVRVVTAEFMASNPDRYSGTWVETFFGVEGEVFAGVGCGWDGTNFIPVIEPD